MIRQLSVFIDEFLVGRLWLDSRGQFCFQYDPDYLQRAKYPLSLSLPLREEVYDNDEPHPFFANLLPEGEIREVVAQKLKVSKENDFGILEKIGGDCAGAVFILPEGKSPDEEEGYYEEEDDAELKELLLDRRRPLLVGESGVRLSLAGAQRKLPVFYDGEKYYTCHGSIPSNYIIKPPIRDLDNTVENEAFCMKLAANLGFPVANSFIQAFDNVNMFVIQRYDRFIYNFYIFRLHQEDFCQALGVLPKYKYEAEGGPSFKQCYELLKQVSVNLRDSKVLIRWLIFNFLIGNADNHAKNISILYDLQGPALAPFYDLISTRIYPHIATGLAMAIGGEDDAEAVQKRHWQALAEEINIKPAYLIENIKDLCEKIQKETKVLLHGEFDKYKCDALYRLVQTTNLNAEKTLRKVS